MERPDRKYWLSDVPCKLNTNIYAGKLEEYCDFLEKSIKDLRLHKAYYKDSRLLSHLWDAGVENWKALKRLIRNT